MRFTPDQLQHIALIALEQAYAQCFQGPVERTEALRFALAYLSNRMKERWPCDQFWKGLAMGEASYADNVSRCSVVDSALNGIYLQLGVTRDHRVHWKWRKGEG
jgi:hypothetical protein